MSFSLPLPEFPLPHILYDGSSLAFVSLGLSPKDADSFKFAANDTRRAIVVASSFLGKKMFTMLLSLL